MQNDSCEDPAGVVTGSTGEDSDEENEDEAAKKIIKQVRHQC